MSKAAQLDLVARLQSAFPELPDAPTPDLLDHARIDAYLKPVHDVGGEPDAPMKYENKDYEYWEHMTYVICEVLAWRGIWLSEERRRIGNVDVGRAVYLGFPYYGRWLLSVARVLIEKHHIGLTELSERMAEVKQRYADGLAGTKLAAHPKSEGDGSAVKRNSHIVHAVGKGDPQVYAGKAGDPQFNVGDPVTVRELPVLFYTRTPEYVRGATGEIDAVAYESPAPEDETWDIPDAKPEWFYVVRFSMAELWDGFNGPAADCSCYPRPILGNSPERYRTPNYRRRLVRWPRQVLAEFGLYLSDEIEVRVQDSNQKHRFMVMPMRPAGTDDWTEDQLTEILQHIVGRNQVWPRMAAKYGVENPVPPWKTSLDGLCDALDQAACVADVPSFKERRDEEDHLSATLYADLPYPENQLVSLAHSLLERGVITEPELRKRLSAVRARLEA